MSVERSALNVERCGAAGRAVFLSYASQDAEAAKRITEALRAAGVEVWFDQSELRGGDAWDAMIRKRIKECVLFVPIITLNTNARAEGYFRLEWKLAVDRSHLMADDAPFLFPIVVGDVNDATARVPDKFREVQWTRVRLDESPAELAGRIARLLSAGPMAAAHPRVDAPMPKSRGRWQWWMTFPLIGAIMGLMFAALPLWRAIQGPPPKRQAQVPVAPQLSEARQLADKVRGMSINKYNSTADDYATAEGLLKRALELEQNDAEIWAISSLFHTSIRTRGFDHAPVRREMARRDAERAVKLAPDSASALFALGRTQRDTDAAAAEVTFKKLLERDPNNSEAMSQLAWIYDGLSRVEEAAAIYDRVLVLDPGGAALTRYVQFLLFFHHGRFAEAEHSIRQSVALQPSANSTAGLAMLLLTWKGDAEGAGRTLATAPDSLYSEPRMVWVTALAQLARRNPEEILRSVQRLQADYIQDNWFAGPKAYFTGWAHALAGRNEAARVAWESALSNVDARLKTVPERQELHLLRGQLLAWLGQAEEARREARTIEELRAGQPVRLWVNSPVLIHAALGDVDAALPLLEALLTWDRNDNTGWPLTPALLRLDPRWDKLRGDPRFQALMVEAKPVEKQSAITPVIDQKSVAVLAFANLSDDKANEYFSDGISEELLNVLAKIPGLKVTARTSSFHFKGKDTAIAEIARQLGVAYVVEGSVRKAGDQVRITAQLIKAADGFHVWSENYDRELKDIFAIQSDVAGRVAAALKVRVLGADQPVAIKAPTANLQAYQLYQTGRFWWNKRTKAGLGKAMAAFQDAIKLDPDYAEAYAGLAIVHALAPTYLGTRTVESEPKARAAALKALELDPGQAEARAVLGSIKDSEYDWSGAEKEYRQAIALNPNYATAHHWLSNTLMSQGHRQEARAAIRRAGGLDPLSLIIKSTDGWIDLAMGQFDQAIQIFRQGLDLDPDFLVLHEDLGSAYLGKGMVAEALVEFRKMRSLDPEGPYGLGELGYTLALAGDTEGARAVLREIGGWQIGGLAVDYQSAKVWLGLGDLDQVFRYLDRAQKARENMGDLKAFPRWRALHVDPRWPEFMRRMNLAP